MLEIISNSQHLRMLILNASFEECFMKTHLTLPRFPTPRRLAITSVCRTLSTPCAMCHTGCMLIRRLSTLAMSVANRSFQELVRRGGEHPVLVRLPQTAISEWTVRLLLLLLLLFLLSLSLSCVVNVVISSGSTVSSLFACLGGGFVCVVCVGYRHMGAMWAPCGDTVVWFLERNLPGDMMQGWASVFLYRSDCCVCCSACIYSRRLPSRPYVRDSSIDT